MGFKQKIAQMRAEKTVKERVFDLLDQFSENEEAEVRSILMDLLEVKGSKIAKKEYVFAKPAVASAEGTKKRGRKLGSKNKVKAAVAPVKTDAASDEVSETAAAPVKGRGRQGKFPKIHETETRDAVIEVLRTSDSSLSPREISSILFKTGYEAHRQNPSFQSRLAAILNGLCKDGQIKRSGRGVYELVNK